MNTVNTKAIELLTKSIHDYVAERALVHGRDIALSKIEEMVLNHADFQDALCVSHEVLSNVRTNPFLQSEVMKNQQVKGIAISIYTDLKVELLNAA